MNAADMMTSTASTLYAVDTSDPRYPELQRATIKRETPGRIILEQSMRAFGHLTCISKTFHSHMIHRTPDEAWDKAILKLEEERLGAQEKLDRLTERLKILCAASAKGKA